MNLPLIEDLVKELPLHAQWEVRYFAEFLRAKYQKTTPGKRLRQDWAGALSKYRHQYTSVELQKKALEWRNQQT